MNFLKIALKKQEPNLEFPIEIFQIIKIEQFNEVQPTAVDKKQL